MFGEQNGTDMSLQNKKLKQNSFAVKYKPKIYKDKLKLTTSDCMQMG